jgi:immune inhibitor A
MQIMSRKLFYSVMILALVLALPSSFGLAQAPSAAQSAPKPIGMISPAGKHLTRPAEEVVIKALTDEGVLQKNATADQSKAAVDKYYQEFSKQSSDWISPEIQMAVLKHEKELTSKGIAAQATPPAAAVSVSIFALAVEFSGTDTITACDATGDFTGPLQGAIAAPAAPDNQTLWYAPSQTEDPNFYADLIFGYKGAGRVRMDLIDPHDGQPGINLAGFTVQDYYDHFAGKGNVTLEGMVSGWVNIPHSEAYYGYSCNGDDGGGDVPVGQVVNDGVHAFMAAHPDYYTDTSATAFWKQFDKNHDGIVDTTWIIHAGAGEEAGGGAQGANAIWSHSWTLAAQGVGPMKVYEGDPETTADDISIDPYTVQPENADLGVFVEEFGHNFFGLPDLYTTDVENSIGFWSEMAGGSWGGDLGGTTPVGMPLWFRMIATCGDDALGNPAFCNWQYPMVVKDYQSATQDIILGALDGFNANGAVKGVQINLPPTTKNIDNKSGGKGNAVWSGTGINDLNSYLSRSITVPASGNQTLSFQTSWDIEDCRPDAVCDFGAVQIKDGAGAWTYVSDGTANFDTSFGVPILLGKGGPKIITIDLSAYAGKTVSLRFRYVTDPGYTATGWWIDDVKVGGVLVDDFESGLGGWTNAPGSWTLTPFTLETPRYYLVEWRSTTKYDSYLRSYVTTLNTPTAWQVERVQYNIPGAVVYLRDAGYPEGYSQAQYNGDDPSVGPKNKLLVVDMNYTAMRLFDSAKVYKTALNNRSASYDSALTLQPSQPITLSAVATNTGVLPGPFSIPSKPAVTTFNDAKGYYAGFYVGAPCKAGSICYANSAGSAVVPARDVYSTRITDFGGNPDYADYGTPMSLFGLGNSWLGSGNPGDDMLQLGVNVDLLSKSVDGMNGTIRVRNYSVDFQTKVFQTLASAIHPEVTYFTTVTNNGMETANNIHVTYNLDANLNFKSAQCPLSSSDTLNPQGMVKVCNLPALAPGKSMVVTLTAEVENPELDFTSKIEHNDGQILRGPFWFTNALDFPNQVLLPFIQIGAAGANSGASH